MTNLQLPTKNRPEAIAFTTRLVEHDRFVHGLLKINQVHRTHSSEPSGLMLLGEPGVGKTKMIEDYKRRVERLGTVERDCNTVLIAQMASSNSVDRFYARILRALNDPKPSSGRIPDKEMRVYTLLEEQNVELIVIDEVHNILPSDTDGSKSSVIANHLKDLLIVPEIPVILVGEPRAITLQEKHPAILSRFQNTHKVTAMSCSCPKEFEYFQVYMKGIGEAIGLRSIEVDSEDFVLRMWAASGGNPREIRKIVVSTIDYADLTQPLNLKSFSIGYEMAGGNPFDLNFNPFNTKISTIKKRMRVA